MKDTHKYINKVLFLITVLFVTSSFAYESEKGKIDMHGGKGDGLLTKDSAFGMATALGSVLNKKGSDKKENVETKKFIKIENIDKIEEDTK